MTVVGIGASAGGLSALEALVARLPEAMAAIVLQHHGPEHGSMLTDILTRAARRQVETAAEGARLRAGAIYVIPGGVDATVSGGVFRIAATTDRIPRESIDQLFASLAADLGPAAIGVVLSGVGHDGTAGLRAIKAAGGLTFVQDPATAEQPGMPESALAAGCADVALAPPLIGDALRRLGQRSLAITAGPGLDEAALARILHTLQTAHGVDFTTYKTSTIERRIARRMALRLIDRTDEYVELLATRPDEVAGLYADLLIGVTDFFRDGEPFELLKTAVFPRLLSGADLPIRIWVPGCSTGEEAYSVAMTLFESLDGRLPPSHVQIFGTDIDEAALAHARAGVYSDAAVASLSPDRLARYFTRHDHGHEIIRPLREMLVFARHNLGKDPPFSRLDLVTCRNVLIYMQPALQKRVLRSLHYALNPNGYLLLGASESVGDSSELFSLVDRKLKLYVKKNTASAAVFDFAAGMRPIAAARPPSEVGHRRPRPPLSLEALADRKVLELFTPPGVLLDANFDVQQFRGQTSRFLSPAPGEASLNVLKLVRPELMLELRTALATVAAEGAPLTVGPVPLRPDGTAAIVLEVVPIHDGIDGRRGTLVLFRDAPPPPPPSPATGTAPALTQIDALERDLRITREYLETSVLELQTSNEELQSANEELQSANEELQSTNEELETSKEELQSTNEELSTVNDELQRRLVQLAESNDDLLNVFATMSAAIVFVGTDLRIRRFSSAAARLLNLVADDVGRPVAYLSSALEAPQLEAAVAETIARAHERAQRVRCSDGQSYTLRAFPYRSAEAEIRGAVLEFVKAPPGRKYSELPEVHEFGGKVLSSLPDALILVDDQLRVVWVNRAFFETFMVGAEIIGHSLEDVVAGAPGTHAALWTALERTVAGAPAALDTPIEGTPLSFSARRLPAEGDRPAMTLFIIRGPAAP